MGHTAEELRQMKFLPLTEKIKMTRMRILQWSVYMGLTEYTLALTAGKTVC